MNIDELSIMIYQFLQEKGDEVPKNLLNERKNEVSASGLLLLPLWGVGTRPQWRGYTLEAFT
jgi:hypothetical protein